MPPSPLKTVNDFSETANRPNAVSPNQPTLLQNQIKTGQIFIDLSVRAWL